MHESANYAMDYYVQYADASYIPGVVLLSAPEGKQCHTCTRDIPPGAPCARYQDMVSLQYAGPTTHGIPLPAEDYYDLACAKDHLRRQN